MQNFFHSLNIGNTANFFVVFFFLLVVTKYTRRYISTTISTLGNLFVKNDYLLSFTIDSKMLKVAAYLIPILIMNVLLRHSDEVVLPVFPFVMRENIAKWMFVINTIYALYWLSSFLSHSVSFLKTQDKYRHKPLHGIAQIILIAGGLFAIAALYARFTKQSPTVLFTTLSVVSMAVFLTLKDVILGIISTLLIIVNDIVRVGDRISSEKHGADGIVVEISLITVKVENFDKSLSVVPTYHLVSDGFINRENINRIDSGLVSFVCRVIPNSVRHIEAKELDTYRAVTLIEKHIDKNVKRFKQDEPDFFVRNEMLDVGEVPMTNLGLFRKYLEKYIISHPMTSNRYKSDTVVRIVESTREGIGLQVECFVKSADETTCNHYQSTLLEHIYASAHKFKLKIV